MTVADNALFGGGIVTACHKLAGKFALRVVGAADKGAKLAKPEAETAALAVRATAHQFALIILLEEVAAKFLVQHVDDIGNRQFRGAVYGHLEIAPETLQQHLPVQLSVGHLVELPLELCREVIFDITGEGIVQEADHEPAPILGNELAAVLDDIGSVLKHLNDRGIG